MVAGTPLTAEQVAMILTLLRKGVESHAQIAAGMNLSRHTVHRISRVHGIPNMKGKAERLPRLPVRTDDAWVYDAKCRGDLGFTELDEIEQRHLCEPKKYDKKGPDCPVKDNCLERGLASGPPFGGVFGGKGTDELTKIWRRRRREERQLEVAS